MPSENNTQMTEDKYAPTAWGGGNEFDFTTPSGQLCRLRRMDPVALLGEGLLDKLDFLTSMVVSDHLPNAKKTALERAKEAKAKVGTAGMTEEEKEAEKNSKVMEEIFQDPKRMQELVKTLDKVLVAVTIKPEILAIPEVFENNRVEGAIYTDHIDFNDKMAIFNRMMKGVKDLESFREDAVESVGSVARSASVSKPTKRITTRKR